MYEWRRRCETRFLNNILTLRTSTFPSEVAFVTDKLLANLAEKWVWRHLSGEDPG